MDLLDLIKLLHMNYSGSFNEYDFFMELIDHCICEDEKNPFIGIEKDTVERGIRGQNGLNKSKLKKVNQMRKVGGLAKYIETMYSEDKTYIMEPEIKSWIPEFNPDGAEFAYPCEDLFFQLLNDYINTTNKRSKKKQERTQHSVQSDKPFNMDTDYYHLVVTLAEIFNVKYVDVSIERSLACISTPEEFRGDLKNRDKEFIASLYQYPALICQENTKYNGETDPNQICILARIKRIKVAVRDVRIYFEPIATFSQVLMNENSIEFDLDNTGTLTTLNTSHWSIHETNLKEAFEETEIPLTF